MTHRCARDTSDNISKHAEWNVMYNFCFFVQCSDVRLLVGGFFGCLDSVGEKYFWGFFRREIYIINPRTCVEFNIKFLSVDDGGAGAGWKIQIDYE